MLKIGFQMYGKTGFDRERQILLACIFCFMDMKEYQVKIHLWFDKHANKVLFNAETYNESLSSFFL